ncbi:hypothetical protein TWF506_004081 [Arthrobotrys conoides]|uniref:F-box domain-containing protein n=1 Tax=Arthrobotrys conoides TaxID=74498 RepID=A0AAN8N3L4_9PEZI
MSFSLITTIPCEIQAQILSFLPITSQIAAYQVCALWRALLLTSQLQASRYELTPQYNHKNLLSLQQKEPTYVHQLLYNEIFCGSTCPECIERLDDFEYVCSFPRSESYYPESVTRYPQAYLFGILGPDQEILTYELRIKTCTPLGTTARYTNIPISPSHPFLNEPVLAPRSRRGMNEADIKKSRCLQYTRTPGLSYEVTPNDNELNILASTTVRELTLQAWEMMRKEMDTTGIRMKKMYCVRFAFPTHPWRRKDALEIPTLVVDLEAEDFDFQEEESSPLET